MSTGKRELLAENPIARRKRRPVLLGKTECLPVQRLVYLSTSLVNRRRALDYGAVMPILTHTPSDNRPDSYPQGSMIRNG